MSSLLPHPLAPVEKPMKDFLHVALSVWIAKAIAAQPHRCFANAWKAFIEFPQIFCEDGRFIEGWFVIETEDRVTINEHGWCERADGTIVDPSVLLLVSPDTSVWYFPGVTRTWEETEALEGEWFPQVRF